jgi:hypothetical protein
MLPTARVAACALPQRPSADDVRDREPPARSEHARRLGEDPVLHGREVDDAVGDDGVEARIAERQRVDRRLDELDEAVAVAAVTPW